MKTALIIASIYCIFFVSPGLCVSSHEDELRKELMDGYNPTSLPSKNVLTRIRFTVVNFDLDERNQAMDISLWVHMTWTDPRLSWRDSGKFFLIKSLPFPANSIWKPDITLYNHAEPRSADPYIKTEVVVKNNGNMTWVPPAQIKASCTLDMTYWPHDVHNCTMKFGSWVHSINDIDLYAAKDSIVSVEGTKNFSRGEWKVTDSGIERMSKLYACCEEEYVSITTWMVIERIASAYTWLVQAPAIVLGIFTFVIFLFPPCTGEKIIFGGFTLILDFFFLLRLSRIIQYSPEHTPLIVKYVTKQLILTTIALIISIITLQIARSNYSTSIPNGLKKILKILAKVLYITDPTQPENDSQGTAAKSESKGSRKCVISALSDCKDWHLLVLVVDRICLLLFAFIFFVNLIIYSSVL